jgi:flagellar M-ring protein FliF
VSDPKPFPLPLWLSGPLGRAREWYGALPRALRILLVSTAAVALLFAGGTAFERANEPYTGLFSQLDHEDAAAIVAKLKEMKVPYRLGPDGSAVEVPESRARELRLELAGAGLPRGGGVGFESFDKMRLGATDFEQRVLYRRALEGELARTIGTIGAVESARVHLVLPEKSVFIARSEPASASIALRLHHARALGPSEVAGVVHLVASAVPGLEADRITVVTTDGTMLHRPRKARGAADEGEDEDVGSSGHAYETSMEDRVRAMLERVVGPGHADVRVTAEMDPARVERLEEHFDPNRSVLRSEEQSIEHSSNEAETTIAGVPGAESNLPTGASKGGAAPPAKAAASAAPAASATPAASASAAPAALAAAAPASGSVRESHTRNYEIDHVTEKRVVNGGSLRRLTVAVVLDGLKTPAGQVPRSRDELDKLAALVRSAAGASDARGDLVTVESIPFVVAEAEPSAGPPGPGPIAAKLEVARHWAPFALGSVLVLTLAMAVLKRRGQAATDLGLQLATPSAPSALEGVLQPVLDSGDLRARAHARATQDPATAALVLRFWLGNDTPQTSGSSKS